MLGAIIGDIVGSGYEAGVKRYKTKNISLFSKRSTFTDDTVLTIATADAILTKRGYAESYLKYGKMFPGVGYGEMFREWLEDDKLPRGHKPYGSYGNGSAMRVSPVGFAYNSFNEILHESYNSAAVTHNHPEGLKGAFAVSLAIFLARQRPKDKLIIKEEIKERCSYDLDRTLDEIRPTHSFDPTCQGTVPQAIKAFLESTSFEDAIRNAVSLGGDTDTLACITGGIAQAFYEEIPKEMKDKAYEQLPTKFVRIIEEFNQKFNINI